jgi:hypothetical protein
MAAREPPPARVLDRFGSERVRHEVSAGCDAEPSPWHSARRPLICVLLLLEAAEAAPFVAMALTRAALRLRRPAKEV